MRSYTARPAALSRATVSRAALAALAGCLLVLSGAAARGQIVGGVQLGGSSGGVYVDPDGTVRSREGDNRQQLEQARARARHASQQLARELQSPLAPAKAEALRYVSLPKLVAQVRACVEAGREVPAELRYLGGLTRVRYLIALPEEKDLVIAGPAEPWDATNPWEPVGRHSGRPVLQLDDLVVCLRMGGRLTNGSQFGCSIDPAPDSLEKSGQVMREFAAAPRAQRMAAMAKALGPQAVRVFGAAADTRLAFACVAADYQLKRLSLGVESAGVPGVGTAIDHSRAAASRVWFELAYEPLLVSADGSAFELRGPRLRLQAGAQSFDPRGATAAAAAFAQQVSAKMPQLAAVTPLFADLQNIADLSVVAALIRQDRLDRRAGWDASWLLETGDVAGSSSGTSPGNTPGNSPGGKSYRVAIVPVPRTAETLVAFTNGSICAGGVILTPATWVDAHARQKDEKGALGPIQSAAGGPHPSPAWGNDGAGAEKGNAGR